MLRDILQHGWTPWQQRRNAVFWRGPSTGIQGRPPKPLTASPQPVKQWDWLQRLHLCAMARTSEFADQLDIGLSQTVQVHDPEVVRTIAEAGFLLGPVSLREAVHYRYGIVADGNSSVDSGLLHALLSGTCVLLVDSVGGFRSWYYDRLQPGITHIAVKSDLSDLEQQLAWAFEHPQECERMAAAGHALAASMSVRSEFEACVERVRTCIK
jgi:Glycosyl transferase family 90